MPSFSPIKYLGPVPPSQQSVFKLLLKQTYALASERQVPSRHHGPGATAFLAEKEEGRIGVGWDGMEGGGVERDIESLGREETPCFTLG